MTTPISSLPLALVRTDGGTQARAAICADVVEEYAENVDRLPPVVVFHDGKDYWLADGFQRHAAHAKAARRHILAAVYQGTRRDAVLYSVGANATHGLRRTNADKRRAVETLLRDPEWGEWSDREIARRTGTSDRYVNTIRALSANRSQTRTVTRGGTTFTMNVARIAPRDLKDLPPAERLAAQRAGVAQEMELISPSDDGLRALRVRVAEAVIERIDTLGEDRAEVITRLVMGV